jgi:hypothetical protein
MVWPCLLRLPGVENSTELSALAGDKPREKEIEHLLYRKGPEDIPIAGQISPMNFQPEGLGHLCKQLQPRGKRGTKALYLQCFVW